MMHNEPNSQLPGEGQTTAPATESLSQAALSRRRQVLAALGKGAAGAGLVGVPMVGHATRSYTIVNSSLPAPGLGYCTVSGFQSAAISVAPGSTLPSCSGLMPAKFIAQQSFTYSDATTGANGTRQRRGIQTALTTTLNVAATDAQADALKVGGAVVEIGNAIYWTSLRTNSGGTITEVKRSAQYPSVIPALAKFGAAMGVSASPDPTLLKVLFDGHDDAYFAAAYLSCAKDDNATSNGGHESGRIPFDASYVGKQYRENKVAATTFFRAFGTAAVW